MGKKRLTTKSHYEASIMLHGLLNGIIPDYVTWEIKYEHIQILKMFIIEGKNAREIAESGIIQSNRNKPMSSDNIIIWLHKYLPTMEYEETPSPSTRNKDKETTREFTRLKQQMPKTPCVMCGSTDGLELDHIIPYFEGGSTTEANLQWLCKSCHQMKSNSEIERAGWFELIPLRIKHKEKLAAEEAVTSDPQV